MHDFLHARRSVQMYATLLAVLLSAGCRDVVPTEPRGGDAPPVGSVSATTSPSLIASTDFSEYAADAKPADWTHRWITSGGELGSWRVRRDSTGQFEGNSKLVLNTPSAVRRAFSWNKVGEPANVRIHTRLRISDDTVYWPAGVTVIGAGHRLQGGEIGYSWRFRHRDGFHGMQLMRYINGSYKSLQLFAFPYKANTFYHLMLERNGDALRGKVWADGSPEPDWQIAVTDTMLKAGWVGLDNQSVVTTEFDFVRVYDPMVNASVPAIAPDSVPNWVYAEENIISNSPLARGKFLRNIVIIGFQMNATQAERQAAVEAINGTVIGGRRWYRTDGDYFVQIQDDGTARPLFQALETLNALPQVDLAYRELIDAEEPASMRPNDGPGWTSQGWRLHPDSASGPRWGLEAIAAPLAWGCETGSPEVPIAVVDIGFPSEPDITPHTQYGDWPPASLTHYHGTAVTSILAARGSNDDVMTGMMWDARPRQYDIRIPTGNTMADIFSSTITNEAIADAVLDGAKVINISLQMPRPTVFDKSDSAKVNDRYKQLRRTIRILERHGHKPLIVVAAGNYNIDAYWAGFPNLKRDFPDRVLVVGAAMRAPSGSGYNGSNFNRWVTSDTSASNWGELVDVVAPGHQVGVIGAPNTVLTRNGTSFAAPYVSGLAGLLLSFDPRLSVAEVANMIVQGAAAGGRSVDSGPFANVGPRNMINAYESLKVAAERTGARVCGNPVWQDPLGNVYTQRGPNWTGSSEWLFTGSGAGLSPQHRGSILVGSTRYVWENGIWVSSGSTSYQPDNATMLSKQGFSHSRDTAVTAQRRPGADPRYQEEYDLYLNGQKFTTISAENPRIDNVPAYTRCVRWPQEGTEWSNCADPWPVYENRITSTYSVSYSSARGEVILAVALETTSSTIEEAPYLLYGDWHRNHGQDRSSLRTHLLFVDAKAGSATYGRVVRQHTFNSYDITGVGVSDDGQQLVMRFNSRFFSGVWNATGYTERKHNNCDAGYYHIRTTLQAITFLPLVRDSNTCYSDAVLAP